MQAAFEKTQTAVIGGRLIAYREVGEGDPVVFVHGGVSDLRTWDEHLPVIGKHFRAISYSRRYARPNEGIPPGQDDQILPHVEDLAAFIKKIATGPSHIVAHSWGGVVALYAAMHHPELVQSLALIEPPAINLFVDNPPKPSQILPLLFTRPQTAFAIIKLGAITMDPAEKAFRDGDDKTAIEIFGRGVLGKKRFAALSPERYQQIWHNRNADKAQLLGAGFPPISDADVRTIEVPVLLISGRESPKLFRLLNKRLSELLPNSESVTIEGASHIVHEDAKKATINAILKFLASAG